MKRLLIPVFFLMLPFQSCITDGNAVTTEIPQGVIPVQVWPIQPSLPPIDLTGTGQFTTDDETILSFKTGGIVSQVLVSEGEAVRKGQLLASLDLTEMNAAVAQAQLGYEKALRDYQRAQRLLADSVATVEQTENAKTALDISTQTLQAARFNLNFSQIKAVNDGFVLRKFVNPGQQVAPGTPIFQTNGSAKGSWKLKIALSDRDWAMVSEGDTAAILTPVEPERPLKAQVKRKAKVADTFTGTYQVELELLEKAPEYLVSGMFGSASLQVRQAQPSWFIPYEALLDANGGKGFVFVAQNDKVAKMVPVRVGRILPDKVQITEGLENYSQLIISGSAYLRDQSPILIKN